MINVNRFFVMLLGVALLAASQVWAEQEPAAGNVARAEPLATRSNSLAGQMNNSFAIDLYSHLVGKEGNLFFSPTSIQTALEMTWAGAHGKTADEMAKALHLDAGVGGEKLGALLQSLNADGKQGGYELAVANALWGAKAYPFQPAFLARVERDFGGHLSDVDFVGDPEGARKTINDWVAGQTHDKIRDLLPARSVDAYTRLVLTNAIYFKAKWDLPFRKEATQDGDFTLVDGKKVKAPLMHQTKHFRYAEDDSVQVLELPYGHGDLAMQVFLPKSPDGLAAFEKGMTAQRLAALIGQLKSENVNVTLPRFNVHRSYELGPVLQEMGMKLAFDGDQADFSGMTTAERVAISKVIHKTFVNVDEDGTEAAAATAVIMMAGSAFRPIPPKVFTADHPFVFAIVHQKSGAMLFMGRLAEAAKE